MKVNIEIELIPFNVPDCVMVPAPVGKREEGFKIVKGIPLCNLDSITLDKMCNEFRDAVFKKAGKEQPPRSKEY